VCINHSHYSGIDEKFSVMPKPRELELTVNLAKKHKIPGSMVVAVNRLAKHVSRDEI
jgi:hypothetical protein